MNRFKTPTAIFVYGLLWLGIAVAVWVAFGMP